MNIVSKEIMSTKASNSAKKLLDPAQCNTITMERLNAAIKKTTSSYATTGTNNLTLLGRKAIFTVPKEKTKLQH